MRAWLGVLATVGCLLLAWFGGARAPLAQAADPLEEATRLAAEADRLWLSADWESAEAVLLRALRLREQALGPVHADVARLIDRVGRTHFNRHDYGLAVDWFREAVEVGERALGPMHLDLAEYLGDLGAALRDIGRPEEGAPYVLRSLSIRRTLLGPESQPVGASLLNLGRNYLRQGRIAEGRATLDEAIVILERTMGPDAKMVDQARDLLAMVTRDQRRSWMAASSLLGLLIAATLLIGVTLWAETPRQSMPARPAWAAANLVMLAARLGFYVASFFVASFYLAPLMLNVLSPWIDPERGILKLIGLIGVVVAFVLLGLVQNAMRWLLGRPLLWSRGAHGSDEDPGSTRESPPAEAGISVTQALRRGTLWVNLPVFVLLVTGFGGAGFIAQRIEQQFGLDAYQGIGLAVCVLLLGVGPAWLWWAVAVPKWRLWAMQRVADWPSVKRHAIAAKLIWPDGHLLGRSEIKSRAHTEAERALEGRFSQE